MKNSKLIPGLVLVLIGAAILLSNFGYLHFHWYNIIHLWPIFLVIGGINLVFAHNRSPWAAILKISVVVIGFGLMLFGNFSNRYNFWPAYHYNFSDDDNDDSDTTNSHMDKDDDDDDDDSTAGKAGRQVLASGTFNEPFKAGIKQARLNISGGGTAYNLSDTTGQLFTAATKDDQGRYNFSHSMDDSVYVVDFKMKEHNGFNFDSDKNKASIRLNPNPEWEINVETGAAAVDFDLSKFKLKKLKLDGGAASFDVRIGAPLALTDVDISTGVSSVNISIPQNAACSIETDSGLSDNHFDGFNKTSGDHYETPGYNASKNKINIHISGGLSDFKVHRY